jgi:hypothetical protein
MKTKKTVYPSGGASSYNDWMESLTNSNLTAEERFEAEFMRIWSEYKQSIIDARTKK